MRSGCEDEPGDLLHTQDAERREAGWDGDDEGDLTALGDWVNLYSEGVLGVVDIAGFSPDLLVHGKKRWLARGGRMCQFDWARTRSEEDKAPDFVS